MAGRGRPRKAASAAKGHKLPEPIPELFEVTDTMKKTWIIGQKIGSGGFGTVYFASEASKKNSFDYVVKVEYHANGPLFVEMHCYRSIGKPECISEWTKTRKLPYLGLSPCYGFGSFEYKDAKYRFMVIERYDVDLQKLLEENNKRFPPTTVYRIGIYLLNVIEYIHSTGYIHGDIKAANLLLGRKPGTENQVYLVDMGLACKYLQDTTHKKEAPDPKKAHNGTPEFTSRDAHRGCFSRRSDLEILCFNLLQWLSGELPWEKFTKDCKKLQQEKEKHMKDIDGFMNILFENEPPSGMKKLLLHVNRLEFEQEPDYNLCRKILMDELKKIGGDKDTTLEFHTTSKKKAVSKTAGPSSNKENARIAKTSVVPEKRKPEVVITLEDGTVPTPAMLEIMNKRAEVKSTKTRRKK